MDRSALGSNPEASNPQNLNEPLTPCFLPYQQTTFAD
jgi:hypothetical protein